MDGLVCYQRKMMSDFSGTRLYHYTSRSRRARVASNDNIAGMVALPPGLGLYLAYTADESRQKACVYCDVFELEYCQKRLIQYIVATAFTACQSLPRDTEYCVGLDRVTTHDSAALHCPQTADST